MDLNGDWVWRWMRLRWEMHRLNGRLLFVSFWMQFHCWSRFGHCFAVEWTSRKAIADWLIYCGNNLVCAFVDCAWLVDVTASWQIQSWRLESDEIDWLIDRTEESLELSMLFRDFVSKFTKIFDFSKIPTGCGRQIGWSEFGRGDKAKGEKREGE